MIACTSIWCVLLSQIYFKEKLEFVVYISIKENVQKTKKIFTLGFLWNEKKIDDKSKMPKHSLIDGNYIENVVKT